MRKPFGLEYENFNQKKGSCTDSWYSELPCCNNTLISSLFINTNYDCPCNVIKIRRVCPPPHPPWSRCSFKYIPCHVPSANRPFWMGMLRETPMMLDLTWPGISSSPSSVCLNVPSRFHVAGTVELLVIRKCSSGMSHVNWLTAHILVWHLVVFSLHSPSKLSATSISRRTSGSAFSLIVKDAEVCWINRLHMPILICFRSVAMARWMSDVIKWHPRDGAVILISCWNQRGMEDILLEIELVPPPAERLDV